MEARNNSNNVRIPPESLNGTSGQSGLPSAQATSPDAISDPALPTTSTGSGKDLTNLDVMRAVAVLTVMSSHLIAVCSPGIDAHRFGAFGVAIFFVHTALVLMWSLGRRPATVDFYIRRAARIYPLSIFVTLLVLATRVPVSVGRGSGYFVYSHLSATQVVEHLLLVQNLFSGNQLVYVMWTLPIEVQMYLVLPVFFFFLQRNLRLWPLLVFWLVAWLFSVRQFEGNDLNLMFSVCYFLPGIMAYVGFSRWSPRVPGWLFPFALAGLLVVGGRSANWLSAALPALMLGLGLPLFRQIGPGMLARTGWYVARYSYGIYLLHPVALVLGFHLLPHKPLSVQLLVFASSLTALSLAAYHFVEAPGMRFGRYLAARYAQLRSAEQLP